MLNYSYHTNRLEPKYLDMALGRPGFPRWIRVRESSLGGFSFGHHLIQQTLLGGQLQPGLYEGTCTVQSVSFIGYTEGEGGSPRLWNPQNLHAVPQYCTRRGGLL